MDLLFLNGFGPSALTLRAHCVCLSLRFALLGSNELPITWFEGTDAKSGSFINQQLRWPALNLSAVNTAENRELPAKRYVFATQPFQVREAGEWESTQVTVCPEANSSPFIERMTGCFATQSGRRESNSDC